ncbi:MAG: hypothetical protein HRT90_00735 [Candidatus Margulisbacteria bacterium]|nr:hypothetical protein [Candidatus Margulisiibacteriota bacterium]
MHKIVASHSTTCSFLFDKATPYSVRTDVDREYDQAFSIQSFIGSFQGKDIKFHRNNIKEDGHCGFSAVSGKDGSEARKYCIASLKEASPNDKVRECVGSEIRGLLLSDMSLAIKLGFDTEMEDYIAFTNERDNFVREANAFLELGESVPFENLKEALQQSPLDTEALISTLDALNFQELVWAQKINEFVTKESTYLTFLQEYYVNSENYLNFHIDGTSTMDALQIVMDRPICIWHLGIGNTLELVKSIDSQEKAGTMEPIHILHINKPIYQHFDLLLVQGEDVVLPNITQSQHIRSITHGFNLEDQINALVNLAYSLEFWQEIVIDQNVMSPKLLYKWALELGQSTNTSIAYNNLGFLLNNESIDIRSTPTDAKQCFVKAIAGSPEAYQPYINLAMRLAEDEEIELSIGQFGRADILSFSEALAPNRIDFLNYLELTGDVYLKGIHLGKIREEKNIIFYLKLAEEYYNTLLFLIAGTHTERLAFRLSFIHKALSYYEGSEKDDLQLLELNRMLRTLFDEEQPPDKLIESLGAQAILVQSDVDDGVSEKGFEELYGDEPNYSDLLRYFRFLKSKHTF